MTRERDWWVKKRTGFPNISNRRTAESAGGGQNVEVDNVVLFFQKLLLFEIP